MVIAPTQAEIAKKLGVSRQAVGFALGKYSNSRIQLSPSTRERIVTTARELGYRPHHHAQMMRGKKSGLIGFITASGIVQTAIARTYFAEQAIQAAGYGELVCELRWGEDGRCRTMDMLLDAHVEGVLIAGIGTSDNAVAAELRKLFTAKIPLVVMSGTRLDANVFVTSDYRQGMAEVTKHLLALGYRRLALALPIPAEEVNLPKQWVFAERLAGFREAATAAGLSETQARTLYHPGTASWHDNFAPGFMAMRELLANGERPEALLCGNDTMAIGALAACADAGLKVPDDIAITGFDDTTVGQYMRPALTTVAQPTEVVAKKAVELLLKQMRGEKLSASEELVKLPCHVVVRESCGSNEKQRRVV